MYCKTRTVECKHCIHKVVEEDGDFCIWGNAKKKKYLQGSGKGMHCNLIIKEPE